MVIKNLVNPGSPVSPTQFVSGRFRMIHGSHQFPTKGPIRFGRLGLTFPETNVAPENRPLEKEIPIGNHHFQGQTVSFRGGY